MGRTSLHFLVFAILAGTLILASCSRQVQYESPQAGKLFQQKTTAEWKAQQMYNLLKKENPRLVWNECVAEVAVARARILHSRGSISHTDPETGKNPVFEAIRKNCLEFRAAGENLCRWSEDPRELHRVLMESKSHRENILNTCYELVGIGCHEDYCVQLFAGF